MSNSYIMEPQDNESSKRDDTLIIVVNDDGTISVDQETLQNLIMNQTNANVSVVRLGQTQADTDNGDITLTVDPPPCVPTTQIGNIATTETSTLVDPFMEMDPEQIERLKDALRSEQAKQLLGDNATAMFDMLSVEEQQNSLRYCVEWDHCYTSRLSPSDPRPKDPLPIINSPDSDDGQYVQHGSLPTSSDINRELYNKSKSILRNSKPQSRLRRNVVSSPLVGHLSRGNINISQHGVNKMQETANDEDEDEETTSTESSESDQLSDDDSDFGPRGPRRGGVRARGGRKGLTTRGGSMTSVRRRGPNKHMDIEQVRRLDMEMAAAVSAMKSPEKDDKNGFSQIRNKRQVKSMGGKKKDELQLASSSSHHEALLMGKTLQTTNQVKANLISANMIEGDMILTKPGQSRNSPKVTFIQKQIILKPNEFTGMMGIKKQMFVGKGKSTPVSSKFVVTKDKKVVEPPMALKIDSVVPPLVSPNKEIIKTKIVEIKKEKPKQESIIVSSPPKEESDLEKSDNQCGKKQLKKEHKKVPGNVVGTLGPALFSTPDIIRRVGSGGDSKIIENPTSLLNTSQMISPTPSCGENKSPIGTESNFKLESDRPDQETESSNEILFIKDKAEVKSSIPEDLQPSLEPAGIEGGENLLTTLEMQANKSEEEILAEALLLEEELGVDLGDHSNLTADQTLVTSSESGTIVAPAELPVTSIDTEEFLTPEGSSNVIVEQIKKNSKIENKEPIQFVRGGRVITLPPMEAPTTRSKRLQSEKNTDDEKKNDLNVQYTLQRPKQKVQIQMEDDQIDDENGDDAPEMDDDDDEDEEINSDSEDDPDRLWCICKRPHNNRFMICCDVCEDWFHGKCVHVSKAMGQQMEEQGIEWVCPNCTKKKSDENKLQSNVGVETPVLSRKNILSQSMEEQSTPGDLNFQFSGAMQCVVCKKEARSSSIYCSDACILAHAQETLTKDKPCSSRTSKSPIDTPKGRPDARVIVLDRKTGNILTGSDAPTRSNLKTWLRENPTFEAVHPNALSTLQIGGRMVRTIQVQGYAKPERSSPLQTTPKMTYAKIPGSRQTILKINRKPEASNSPLGKAILSKQQTPNKIIGGKQQLLVLQSQPQMKIQTSNIPKQTPLKKQETKSPGVQLKQQIKSIAAKKSEPEPIRLNVRKTLAELLTSRIKETSDLSLADEEIENLALNIELELYKYFKDTGAKYKAKYRSLVFNIKDTKNLTLFRKIADKSLTPDAVVRLSPEEMASQELAEWREKETKHQLEMIKKNELDLMAQAKSIVVKTHKGEQIIENDVDPKIPVQDIVAALNHGDNSVNDLSAEDLSVEMKKFDKTGDDKKKRDKDRGKDRERSREKSRRRDKRERSRSRSRRRRSKERDRGGKMEEKNVDRKLVKDKEEKGDKSRDRYKKKDREREKDREKFKERMKDHSMKMPVKDKDRRDKNNERNRKGDDKKKDGKKRDGSPDKPIEDRLWRHIVDETITNIDGNDTDVSDREPSSTVNIKTPDINEEPERDNVPAAKETHSGQSPTVWQGTVNMNDVAESFITAQEVSGNAKDIMEDLPDRFGIVGRISRETVWDYLSKMKKNGSKEIMVIRFTAANDEEKIPYITLYSYLNSRSRFGVVGHVSNVIKDFYIMPFPSQNKIPPVLLPLNGPGFEEHRPHLLLGILVIHKGKRLTDIVPAIHSKVSKKEHDRSYTPPLVNITKERSYLATPPESPLFHSTIYDSLKEKQINQSQGLGISKTIIDSATISKIVPELSSKIDLVSSPGKGTLDDVEEDDDEDDDDDEDEPYSPGGIDDDIDVNLQASNESNSIILSSSKNSNELQRKMDELNRQIEEQKQQIQNISSSFLGETTTTLPGLGLDPPGTNDGDEAYSPSDARSFTPPPPNTKFTQPILDKVSDITIPANLQEILANVKRQEISKVDSYIPSKPSATFLTTVCSSSSYHTSEKYTSPSRIGSYDKSCKESKSTLSSLSDLDLIRKAEEELAAVAAASPIPSNLTKQFVASNFHMSVPPPITTIPPPMKNIDDINTPYLRMSSEQPKPPGLEDEEFPSFSLTPPMMDASRSKSIPKSGVVLSVKRKANEDNNSPSKIPRTKSRWGQAPSE